MRVLVLVLLLQSQSIAEEQQICENEKYFDNFYDHLKDIATFIRQFDNVSPECILQETCPQLVNPRLCPLNLNGSANADVINEGLDLFSQCLEEKKSICNISLHPINLPTSTVSTRHIYYILPFSADICLFPSTYKADKMYHDFTVKLQPHKTQSPNDVFISFQTQLEISARLQLYFSGFGRNNELADASLIVGSVRNVWNLSGVIRLDISSDRPDFVVESKVMHQSPTFTLDQIPSYLQNANLSTLLSKGIGTIVQDSPISNATTWLAGQFLANAIAAIKLNCQTA